MPEKSISVSRDSLEINVFINTAFFTFAPCMLSHSLLKTNSCTYFKNSFTFTLKH
jgi:hypothetical protein